MNKDNISIICNNNNHNTENDTIQKIFEKIEIFKRIMINTILSIKNNKNNEVFTNSDVNICSEKIHDIIQRLNIINENIYLKKCNANTAIECLQNTIENLSTIVSNYGTYHLEDILYIFIGSEYKNFIFDNEFIHEKYKILIKHFHPISFKTINRKKFVENNKLLCSNKITESTVNYDCENTYECFDINNTNISFFQKVYGLQLLIHVNNKKSYIITGLLDNIDINFISNKYIYKRKEEILKIAEVNNSINKDYFNNFIECLSLKELLIYGNEDIIKIYINIINMVDNFYKNSTQKNINSFIEMDSFSQRSLLISLLVYPKNNEIKYLSYLLYDLLSIKNENISIDSCQQKIIYDSFTWNIQKHFKNSMKHTITYTQDMMNKFDNNKLSLEHQIYLLKVPENVKEKALIKLKEIKGRNDDVSVKSKQYLEGLLKIPFNIYKEEPILKKNKEVNYNFIKNIEYLSNKYNISIDSRTKFTNYEIAKYNNKFLSLLKNDIIVSLKNNIDKSNKKKLNDIIKYFKNTINIKLQTSNDIIDQVKKQLDNIAYDSDCGIIFENIANMFYKNSEDLQDTIRYYNTSKKIANDISFVENSLESITKTLDESIYGHSHAKNQILKIIAQWVNGEQSGYCFGFEGSPGIGKTSLAKKGLAKCLVDDNGNSRPYTFIALGGSSNGSTLEGHSYTYVNSMWGKIVDILMDTKCMNPIIYIDELDKVSKTEHGKEIIGILTHLIDYTQNNTFQDKYFSGINIDLSKALFIFSYNDPDQIDRILLDRIHRIKFDNLTTDDKLIIVKNFILPNINETMGFSNVIEIPDDIIEYIIDFYTLEPGVRKLKEIFFDLLGEINIELLMTKKCNDIELPIKITKSDIENKYLKNYTKVFEKKIHPKPMVGVINGLWANSLGKGGIITIESIYFPSSTLLDFKLTGQQGDVMKESMNVAKNLAWSLTEYYTKTKLIENFSKTLMQGIHVHCNEGSISKDGPSAGAAITTVIYSLLNNTAIKNDIAVTGEIDLQGNITAVGGIENKFLGGIKSGVKTFLFPKENMNEYKDFLNKYKNKNKRFLEKIKFIPVENIEEVLKNALINRY